ncbi:MULTISPECIES: 2-succinylbenzoate--CoA ligase [Fischerella]|uniref:2-succinylbenzoate-CoA ligase n=1 Tax=Fischerella muscicola CCMEE 5323 TaxID=2019572 RepID=A0A2N6JXZ6_FISMU|nr:MULTISPECIES: 2-succinylbenzoate--CoA ligase [Fischerella]MBD2429868.1 2-succinylbenzoate--CoA ligase [Fischerella sp. FACHB-380]PLZ85607.1 2-succinylbenzoate-CoA ligase [Fischerella muscicola CCMEE 5323]
MEFLGNFTLVCDRSDELPQLTEQCYIELTQFSQCQTLPKIILAECEPTRFLAGLIAAVTAKCPVFLCNPNWAKQEWQQVFDLVQPDIIWGTAAMMGRWGGGVIGRQLSSITPTLREAGCASTPHLPISLSFNYPHIMIPTGGSSGKIKFAVHTWETLTASVRGFTEYFQLEKINSFCVLPLYHVSGLMQFMRCFTTGGKLVISPFKEIAEYQLNQFEAAEFFISLVPTQLQSLLQNSDLTTWLSQFQTVLIGGAPAWDEILEKARYYQIRLALTYGMTETASQIATLKPDDFLNGKVNSGQILPHAKVIICNDKGDILNTNQAGNITIQSESLALGYYPLAANQQPLAPTFSTDDIGFIDNNGYLNIVGRNSDKIITGGENVYPTEIESAIKATAMVSDVCVVGIPDQYWGQAVTAIYVPKNLNYSVAEIQNLLKDKLSKFKLPKYWISVENLPRNSQGKINRQQLRAIALDNILQRRGTQR